MPARELQARAVLTHLGGVAVDESHLVGRLGVPAQLEEHHELADAVPLRGFRERRRGLGGIERLEGREVEIGALPISVDERLEHGALLRRTPVAGVDRAEKRARRRLDLSVVDDACHEVGIMAYSSDWL